MGAFAQAIWALRTFDTFADVVTAVIDLGDDADSVAAVAGALAGAKYGVQSIPSRWLTYVHGQVHAASTATIRRYDHLALQELALVAARATRSLASPIDEPALEPREVVPGLWATNRSGRARSRRLGRGLAVPDRPVDAHDRSGARSTSIDQDGDHNPSLPRWSTTCSIRSTRCWTRVGTVVVHCHGGRSRTGLVLAAHMMRHGRSLCRCEGTAGRRRGPTPTS